MYKRQGDQCVKEYDANGKMVWKLDVPGGPHSLTRLPNGHTLIAVADKDQNPRLIEVTPEGKTIWEISNADIPGKPLKFLGGFQYFSDGRFLITNWTGHVNPKEKVHLLLVDRQKNELSLIHIYAGFFHNLPFGRYLQHPSGNTFACLLYTARCV